MPRPVTLAALVLLLGVVALTAASQSSAPPSAPAGNPGSGIQRDADIAVKQPGPHDGGGTTTAYPYFGDVDDMALYFRKRALHPGSGIGYHRQEEDEVYYVLSGAGEYTLDGKTVKVGPGTAMLTRKGSSHSLKQTGPDDLVIIVAYPRTPPAAH